MDNSQLASLITKVAEKSPYPKEAYSFTLEALMYASSASKGQHLQPSEVCDYIIQCATEKFGMLAKTVFLQWATDSSKDFGLIIFDLIECGVLEKNEDESVNDFSGLFLSKNAFTNDIEKYLIINK